MKFITPIAPVFAAALLLTPKAQARQSICQFIVNGGPVQEKRCRIGFNNNMDDRSDPRYGIAAYFADTDFYYTIRPNGEASVVLSDDTVHQGTWQQMAGREAPMIRINGVTFSFY